MLMANRTFYLPSADAPVLAEGCTTILEEEGENEGRSYAQFAYANSYLARSDAVAMLATIASPESLGRYRVTFAAAGVMRANVQREHP